MWVCGGLFAVLLSILFYLKYFFPTLMSTWLLLVFIIAFIYAPIMSFVSARMDGLVGNTITIPYVDEAIRFLTGFRGVEIWFMRFLLEILVKFTLSFRVMHFWHEIYKSFKSRNIHASNSLGS